MLTKFPLEKVDVLWYDGRKIFCKKMTPIQTRIEELLQKSFFVSAETKAEILRGLKNFEEETLQKLEKLLEEADTKQYEFLRVAVEQNPNLPDELNHILVSGMREKRQEEEKKCEEEEMGILVELERVLNENL